MKNTDLYKQIERLKSMIDEGVLDKSEIKLAENKISALKAQTEKNFETEPEKTVIKEETPKKEEVIEETPTKTETKQEGEPNATSNTEEPETTNTQETVQGNEEDEIKKSELIIFVKALFLLVVIFSIYFLLDNMFSVRLVQTKTFYTELFPIICSLGLLFVVHNIRKRRIIQKQELDDKAILKYFSNKELGSFLFLVLLIWLLSD